MIIIILFIFGICFGSFLNVVIDRIPNGKSIIIGRSHCDFCKHPLSLYDLVPIASFLLLKGTCRYCKKNLSWQYPIVEFGIGILFVMLFLIQNPMDVMQFVIVGVDFLLISLGIALAIMDIKYHILADGVIIFFAFFSFIYILLEDPQTIFIRIGIGLLSMLPLLLIFLITKGRGMGFGDVKLVFVMGFFLGFPNILIAYYIAFLTGGLVAIILVILRKKKFRSATIAFGPFLLLGTLLASIFGNSIWMYALRLLGI